MQFNSYIFIGVFLPLMVATYFIGNKINTIWGKIFLIAGSILFYAYSDKTALAVMIISLSINFAFAAAIRHTQRWNKLYLTVPVMINVGLLLYFKYTNFAIVNFNAWFEKEIAVK